MAHGRAAVFIVFDDVKMLDVAGPAQVFAEADMCAPDSSEQWNPSK
ncbi:hypothetical protein AB4Z09_23160 [Rhodococcus sp. TAF43]|nr:hypothetical protein [Rhodococcus sp. W8901]QKT11619.1 hypothetical protein HUN07_13520 [Rhodococcus sp. W8901]